MFKKIFNIFVPYEEYDEETEEDIEEEVEIATRPQKVVATQPAQSRPQTTTTFRQPEGKIVEIQNRNISNKTDILTFTMNGYEMTSEVSKYIVERKIVIVNMIKLSPEEIQRVVDYLTGVCEALNGTIERVAEEEPVFVFAPEGVRMSGSSNKNNKSNV